MEMHQVRYFLALAETRNFTRAAEQCGVSQPSLSRAVAQLEAELGGALVRRERSLTHLTELGERVLPLLHQCHESALSARAVAAALGSGEIGSLRLALPHDVSIAPFATHLTELMTAFPGLRLDLIRDTARGVAATLKDGGAGLAIAEPAEMDWERLESWPLFREPLALALPHRHRLANSGAVSVGDLASERILVARGCSVSAAVAAAVAEAAGGDPAPAVIDTHDALALVERGGGLAILPVMALLSANLGRVSVAGLDFARDLGLYAVRGRRREAPTAMFVTQMRAADWSAYLDPPASTSLATD